jgi:predicted DsbA family dithiol-disulfide isomerase
LSARGRLLYSSDFFRHQMSRSPKQTPVLVYQDVLCAWSWLADLRLAPVQRELADVYRFVPRPYPLRPMESLPSAEEIARAVRDLDSARAERETLPLRPELWTSGDPPRSSIEPLAALEAARLQGEPARLELQTRLRQAALEQGLNVTRPDVVFELAARAGLQMNRFAAAFGSSQTRRLIREEYRLARGRGVRRVPTLVIANRWMISGLRETGEYRELLLACVGKLERGRMPAVERVVH